ncbi:EpsG family protein [Macrococcus capreoli]
MYFLIFAIGIIFSFFSKLKNKITLVFTILLMFLASIRYGIGNDFFGYFYLYTMYDKNPFVVLENPNNFREEFGFRFIASLFKTFNLDYQVFVAFFSIVTLFIVYKTVKKYAVDSMLAMLVFYSLFYIVWIFSGIRQGFTLFAGLYLILYCFEKNKNITLIIGTLILTTVHISALVIIPIYFIAKLRINKAYLLVFFVISVFFSLLPFNPMIWILHNLNINERISKYGENDSLINFDIQSLVRLILTVIVFLYFNSISNMNRTYYYLVRFYIIGIIFYFLFKDIELIAARLSLYSRTAEILLIPAMIELLKKNNQKAFIGLTLIIFLFLSLAKDTYTMSNSVFRASHTIPPYSNIFNKADYLFKKAEFYQDVNFDQNY